MSRNIKLSVSVETWLRGMYKSAMIRSEVRTKLHINVTWEITCIEVPYFKPTFRIASRRV